MWKAREHGSCYFPRSISHSCVIQFPKLSPFRSSVTEITTFPGEIFFAFFVVTQKVQIEEDIFLLLLIVSLGRNGISHLLLLAKVSTSPIHLSKSQRINKKTSGGKKSQTIYPTSINFSKWAAPTFSSPTRIIVDVIIKYHTALSLSHHTHKNWSSKSLGGGRIIMEPLLPFRPPNTKKWGKKFIS